MLSDQPPCKPIVGAGAGEAAILIMVPEKECRRFLFLQQVDCIFGMFNADQSDTINPVIQHLTGQRIFPLQVIAMRCK